MLAPPCTTSFKFNPKFTSFHSSYSPPAINSKPIKFPDPSSNSIPNSNNSNFNSKPKLKNDDDDDHKKKKQSKMEEGISQIQVPRNKHIPVSKSQLLHSLTNFLSTSHHFSDTDNGVGGGGGGGSGDSDNNGAESVVSQFLLLASCLDSIIHAEHKSILEEMRADYFSSHSVRNEEDLPLAGLEKEGQADNVKNVDFVDDRGNGSASTSSEDGKLGLEDNQLSFLNGFDLRQLFASAAARSQKDLQETSSTSEVAAATRFQRSFMKLLQDAQFEELSTRDLMMTSALNTDYLLTLPVYVDWKRASESNAIIFRRGYSTEKEKGLLIVEKLDYLQSKVLQAVFGLVSKPLIQIGVWIKEVIQNIGQNEDISLMIKRVQLWAKETSINQLPYTSEMQTSGDTFKADEDLDEELPIWLAAQKAVSRYEGFLSSIGPRRRLIRKFLSWIGFLPSIPEVPVEFDGDSSVGSEPYMRPVSLSRISLNDIWRPATRQYCENNAWRMLKVGFSIIFSKSILQEPAFEELILLYTEEPGDASDTEKSEIPSLQLKIYEKIPVPDLPVIFPHKKLSFRIIDTVRLDIASIVGLLAFGINYRFENVSSSPSAIMLDVIAATALIVLLIRVGLGYKQTWDRYELLVNRTLYEKTLASGFGSVHFLLDASEQQQYKECILAYAILLKAETNQFPCRKSLGEECERFLYKAFREKVQMPVDKAVDMLIKFGLVQEQTITGKNTLQVVPSSVAYDTLRERWDCLLR
ncbi:uncharacterized protein LOC141596482 [Silene latifolia]|uniref:uncharacterized protein LOC141596482 n=1 Tax=Silene latifolia TaxID=37657 RepID=UPI003D770355